MASLILSIIGLVAVGALAVSLVHTVGVLSHRIDAFQPPDTPPDPPPPYNDTAIVRAVDDLHGRVETLTRAVAEGIDHVDRNEKRVRGIVAGAQRRFDAAGYEDAGVEAEAGTLPHLDASGSEGQGLLPLSEGVEDDGLALRDPWNGVPGMAPGPLE